MVRALVSHQCGPGSTPDVDAIFGLSLLLVLSLAPRGFSPGSPVFPSPQKLTLPNSNSIWNARTRFSEFMRTPMCFVGKQAIYNFFYNFYHAYSISFTLSNVLVPGSRPRQNVNLGTFTLFRATTAKKCTKKGDARAELLFCLSKPRDYKGDREGIPHIHPFP